MHLNTVIETAGWWTYLIVFVLTAAETSAFVGLLVPGEAAVLLAAAVAGQGGLKAPLLAAVVVGGAVTGDNLGFALGRRCRRRPAGRWTPKVLGRHRDGRGKAFLADHSGAALLTGKFIGVARTFLPYAAGSSGMPYRRFFLYSAAASLVWGTGTVLVGYFTGSAAIELLHRAGLIGAAVLAAVIAPILVASRMRARRRRRPTGSTVVAPGGPWHRAARKAPVNSTYARRSQPSDTRPGSGRRAHGDAAPARPDALVLTERRRTAAGLPRARSRSRHGPLSMGQVGHCRGRRTG
ncbi:DedA family protein [Streptomyces sp. NPDC052492]|uniref:DedA family protein n=1 Tax=Streptomyces sp. NPDC052492 TaxID=3365691 RepID=UPI0037D30F33